MAEGEVSGMGSSSSIQGSISINNPVKTNNQYSKNAFIREMVVRTVGMQDLTKNSDKVDIIVRSAITSALRAYEMLSEHGFMTD